MVNAVVEQESVLEPLNIEIVPVTVTSVTPPVPTTTVTPPKVAISLGEMPKPSTQREPSSAIYR